MVTFAFRNKNDGIRNEKVLMQVLALTCFMCKFSEEHESSSGGVLEKIEEEWMNEWMNE